MPNRNSRLVVFVCTLLHCSSKDCSQATIVDWANELTVKHKREIHHLSMSKTWIGLLLDFAPECFPFNAMILYAVHCADRLPWLLCLCRTSQVQAV